MEGKRWIQGGQPVSHIIDILDILEQEDSKADKGWIKAIILVNFEAIPHSLVAPKGAGGYAHNIYIYKTATWILALVISAISMAVSGLFIAVSAVFFT